MSYELTAREIYKHNHGYMRSLTRFEASESDKRAKLHQVLSDRQFWFGDQYTAPASEAAQNSIRTLLLRWVYNSTMEISTSILNIYKTIGAAPDVMQKMRRECSENRKLHNRAIIRKLP